MTSRDFHGQDVALKLQRYILRNLAVNFGVLLLIVTLIIFLAEMVQSMGLHQNVSLALLLSHLPYLVPYALELAIPLALLVGTLLTFGRMAADNELLAIQMAGVHPLHVVTPAIFLGLLLTCSSIYVNGTLAPLANARAKHITKDDLSNFLDAIEASRVNHFHSDRLEMWWKQATANGALEDVRFDLQPSPTRRITGAAKKAVIRRSADGNELWFTFYGLHIETTRMGVTDVEDVARPTTLEFPVASLFATEPVTRKELITSAQLRYQFLRDPLLRKKPGSDLMRRYRIEYGSRIALALSCLVFALLGSSLGIVVRRSSTLGAGFIALVIAFVVYYPLFEVSKNLADEGVVSPALAVSVPDVVVGAVGLLLLYLVARK